MTRIYPVPVAPASMMIGASPTHRQAMANAAAQSTTSTPLSSASTAVASVATVTASKPAFDFAFYDRASRGNAKFCTQMGHSPRRSILQSVEERPFPVVRTDPGRDVWKMVTVLEKQYPNYVRRIEHPRTYMDLYEYFDGYDLWVNGVLFCWHVISTIARKNAYLNHQADQEIDTYAGQWVKFHEDRVIRNPDMRSDLTALFDPDELADLEHLLPGQLAKLRAKLLIYGGRLLIDYGKKGKWEVRPTRLYPVMEGRDQPHDSQNVGGCGTMPPLPCEFNVQYDLGDCADSSSAACSRTRRRLWQIRSATPSRNLAESTTRYYIVSQQYGH